MDREFREFKQGIKLTNRKMDTNDKVEQNEKTDEETKTNRTNKVARLIESDGLGETFGEKLELLWTAEGQQRESLRVLADRFNKRLLKARMSQAGMTTLSGEVENIYHLLTDEDVSSGNRTEARTQLEQHGIDVDQLERDFVTYQAIRSYLKNYRGVDYQSEDESTTIDSVVNTLQRLQSRVQSVSENSLRQLQRADRLTLGQFRLVVNITVFCEDCQTQYDIVECLQQGGCQCQSSDIEDESS